MVIERRCVSHSHFCLGIPNDRPVYSMAIISETVQDRHVVAVDD